MWQGSHFSLGPRWCSINPWSCWPGSALGNQVSLSTCHYLKPVLLCILGLFITNVVYFITSAIFQSTPIIRFCRYQQTTNGSHSFQDGRIHKTDSRSDQCLWQPSITADIILTVIVVFVIFFFFLATENSGVRVSPYQVAVPTFLIICLKIAYFVQPTVQNLKTLHLLSLMAKKKQQIATLNELEPKRIWHCFGAGKVVYSELIRGVFAGNSCLLLLETRLLRVSGCSENLKKG